MSRITPILLLVACASAAPALAGPELKKSDVRNIVMDSMAEIRACGPGLNETITAKWVIAPQGNTTKIRVEGKHANDGVGKCIKAKIAQLRFGHSIKSTPVSFPLKFGEVVTMHDERATRASNGKLTKKDLEGLLSILEGDIKKCGDGTVTTKFTITSTGRVKDVKITEDLDKETEHCVTKKISRVRFPPPEKQATVKKSFEMGEAKAAEGEG